MIEILDLKKSFSGKTVLNGVNLKVNRGDSLVILGGSGTGKSVLLRHMVALLKPDSGEVWVDGNRIDALPEKELRLFRHRFGFAFQEAALFDSMTVFENVAFPLRRHRRNMGIKAISNRVQECLSIVGMPGISKLMPSELSGGMRRRVGFARAIALKPEILFFDEPTSGLDPVMTSILNQVIIDLRNELSATTVTITHDLSSAKIISTHLALLVAGKVVEFNDQKAFFQSQNPMVRQFLEGRAEGPLTQTLLK